MGSGLRRVFFERDVTVTNKILCVDDEPRVLTAYQRTLHKQFVIETATGGQEALTAMSSQGPYAVVVADMQMPVMNGVQFLARAEELYPETVRIMLTGNADQKTAADAVNQGHVFRFLNKPCSPEQLASALTVALKQYKLIIAERELLEKTLSGSVKLLTDILSMADPQSFGRAKALCERVKAFVGTRKLEFSWELEVAAMLSSIGMITIPLPVLYKARNSEPLNNAEKDMLARVPETGSALLTNIPRLENVARIVRYQAKCFDGSGLPVDSVAGVDLPLASRILKVLSDMLELEGAGLSRAKAIGRMHDREGWYDPAILSTACSRLQASPVEAPQAPAGNLAISARELRISHVLAADLFTTDGTLIVCAGTEISQMILHKIHNFRELTGLKEPILIQGERGIWAA